MRPISLKLRGATGVFKGLGLDEIEIDFTRFDPGLIGFVGSNGCGKSTTLEQLHPYRQLASREGALQNHFRLRDSFRDFTFEQGGHTYRANILIDCHTGKQEAYLYRDGQPLNDGKTTTYDVEVEKLLGSAELYFRSIFSAQKAESIASLTAGDRKKLFLELLGLQKYEAYEAFVKGKADGIEGDIQHKRGAVEVLSRTAGEFAALLLQLDNANAEAARLSELINGATKESDHAAEDLSAIEKQIASEQEKKNRLQDLEKQITGGQVKRSNAVDQYQADQGGLEHTILLIEADINRQRNILSHGPEIGEKVARLEAVRTEENILRSKKSDLSAVEAEEAAHKLAHQRAVTEYLRKTQAIETGLQKCRMIEDSAKAALNEKIAQLERDLVNGTAGSALIDEVPCKDIPALVSTCKLLSGALKVRESLPIIRVTIDGLKTDENLATILAPTRTMREELGLLQEQIGDAPTDGLDFASQKAVIGYDRAVHESLMKEIVALEGQGWEKLKGELAVAEGVLAEKQSRLAGVRVQEADLLKKQEEADAALQSELFTLFAQRDEILATLASDETSKRRDTLRIRVNALRDQVTELNDQRISVSSAIGVHQAAIARAEKASADKEVVEVEISTLGATLAHWRLLQQACSKDGIPALELDAAGPEVSRIANELLASTFGTRFQIAFETTRLSKDKKKQIETFEIRVFGEGDEQKIEDLSGGEAVWVETAIRLAIAAYLKQKSGRDIASRQFDEADGALSTENAQSYLDMLRKSHDEGGYYFTFLISHRSELVSQIRQQIVFEKGKGVTVVA